MYLSVRQRIDWDVGGILSYATSFFWLLGGLPVEFRFISVSGFLFVGLVYLGIGKIEEVDMGYKAGWYTDDGHLRSLGRAHLNRLLERYSKELADAKIVIPQPAKDEDFYKELASVFMRPDGIPGPLHDALYFIKGLDNQAGMDRILEAVDFGRLKIDPAEESSIADKALQAWLQDERLVRQMHVEVGLDASKSFIHFQSQGPKKPKMKDFATVRGDLEGSLGVVFEEKGRGYWCEVTSHPRGKDVVFVVRHGEPFRRETKRVKNGTEPLFYWPSSQDLVVYNTEYFDLRMNVQSRWQKTSYAENVGHWLFGDAHLFKEAPLYTLEPIRTRGYAALEGKAYGIESIRLTELQSLVDEDTNDLRIRRCDDVLSAYRKEEASMVEAERPGGGLLAGELLILAKFGVKFAESRKERVVTVEPPNRAKYTQDRDGLCVTSWLREGGFVLPSERADGGGDE